MSLTMLHAFRDFFPLSFSFPRQFCMLFFVCELMLPPIFMVTEHQCFLLYLCWFIFYVKLIIHVKVYVYVCVYVYVYVYVYVCVYIYVCVFYNITGIQIVTASIFGHVWFFFFFCGG